MTRERLAEMVQRGLVTPTGLISHGRGEAFDYLMGERSTDAALQAEKAAAAYLLSADNPVICVNGNAAALDPEGIIALASKIPARIEVNLFHRTPERMEGLISYLESKGAEEVLGRDPDSRIAGLEHDRALCTSEGIYGSDVILVPIEDGDRAEALVAMGKKVISIRRQFLRLAHYACAHAFFAILGHHGYPADEINALFIALEKPTRSNGFSAIKRHQMHGNTIRGVELLFEALFLHEHLFPDVFRLLG